MSGEVVLPTDHEEREWFRLAALYESVTARFIVEVNQFLGQPHGTLLTEAVDHAVLSIGRDSAKAYHVEFRPTEFVDLADQAVTRIRDLLVSQAVQEAVERIVPKNMRAVDRMERSFMPGLDMAGALRVEKFRQENPLDQAGAKRLLMDERNKRVNLLSRTEVVRIGSDVLDLLWLGNLEVEKATTRPLLTWDLAISGRVIPRYARKVWVTRKDGKVCQYCAPLEGITTGVGQYFETIYGTFSGPPIHPQCRCVPALRSMRK